MARLKERGSEAGLREFLLEDAVAFRELYGGRDPELWRELSKPVDQLVGGEAYSFRLYDLPDDHPMRRARGAGGMSDVLALSKDDCLASPCQ
ncbi:hypothetical protein PR370_07345 [Mycobacterium marinum]|uniref:hypothetical protein n=1 Tax=Mycobacterium marinum TaxID=1781 RepID=UPI002358A930|nr:hypothetical protein [Mycobacterium marinum]MDC8980975.1 hypothetical protein [Mycobacterium marinum]MDC8999285.1 hypothetical protein [Mycobacterium marinum]MDC9009856.1 hypothetical protein [Mycobacterium marinum]